VQPGERRQAQAGADGATPRCPFENPAEVCGVCAVVGNVSTNDKVVGMSARGATPASLQRYVQSCARSAEFCRRHGVPQLCEVVREVA